MRKLSNKWVSRELSLGQLKILNRTKSWREIEFDDSVE